MKLKICLCGLIFSILGSFFVHNTLFASENSPVNKRELELFLVAQKAFDDGFYDVSIRYIHQFLQRYPDAQKRIEANLLLGQCYFFKGQYLEAFNIFRSLLKHSQHKDATLFWLGETYVKGSDYSQAQEYYQQLINEYPRSFYLPQAIYSLGWSFFEQGKFEKAKEIFYKLTNDFPDEELTVDASFKIGECEYNLLNYEKAIYQFKEYVKRFKTSAQLDYAYFYIGESNYYIENYPEAVSYYQKAKNISKEAKMILLSQIGLGWSYLKLKDFEKAEQSFHEAKLLAQDQNIPNDEVYLGEANLFSEMKQPQKALKAYDALIKTFPRSPKITEAYLGRANTLYHLEKYDEAIQQYQQIMNSAPQKTASQEIIEKAYFGLAWTMLKKGEIEKAIKNFRKIIEQSENKIVKISALVQMGDAYQDNGNLEKALEVYDKILQDYPDSLYTDYIQFRQGIAFLQMEKIEAATLSFQSLKANFPNSKYLEETNYYLGFSYFKKGKWAAAKEQMQELLDGISKTHELRAEALFILAQSTFQLKDPKNAIKLFKKIIKLYPHRETLVQDSEFNIAKCLYQLGEEKEALQKFKIIVYKYPHSDIALESLSWLGDYYLSVPSYGNAITYYQQILNEYPGNERLQEVRLALSKAYQESGQLDKALQLLKLITTDVTQGEIYAKAQLSVADIFSEKTNPSTAIEQYEDIISNNPEFARDAFAKMARVYLENENPQEALESYRKALNAPKGLSKLSNAEIQFLIGDLHEILNMSNVAIEEYLKIPYLYPREIRWNVKAYLRIARIFEDDEEWENAKLVYNKIIEYGTDEAKFAQERLEWINTNIQSSNN